jgi:hypothetical protein
MPRLCASRAARLRQGRTHEALSARTSAGYGIIGLDDMGPHHTVGRLMMIGSLDGLA